MSLIIPSIQQRRARVNVESIVSFNGVDQSATVSNPNLDAGVQAVSFFVHVNSTFTISKGGWSLTEASLPIGRLVHIVIQGGRLFINTIDSDAATSFPANADPLIVSGDSFVSHFTFFNRSLTLSEIKGIHRTGGFIPVSAHAACVAHYPCTQREGDKLSDVVGQYNYAKATALVPYHATLQNYTAAEHTGAAQSAWKEFYSKQVQPFTVAQFNYTRLLMKTASGDVFGTSLGIANGNAFTLSFHLHSQGDIPSANAGYLFNLNTSFFALKFETGGDLYLTHYNNGIVNLKVGNLPDGIETHLTLVHDGVDTLFCYEQDKLAYTYNLAPSTGNSVALFGGNRTATFRKLENVSVASMRTYTEALNPAQIKDILDYKEPESLRTNWRFSPTGGICLKTGWYMEIEHGSTLSFVERKSLLPPLEKALSIAQANSNYISLPTNAIPYSNVGYMHFVYVYTGEPFALFSLSSQVAVNDFFQIHTHPSFVARLRFYTFEGGNGKDDIVHPQLNGVDVPPNLGINVCTLIADGTETYFVVNGVKTDSRYTNTFKKGDWFARLQRFNSYNTFNGAVWILLGRQKTPTQDYYYNGQILDFHIGDYVPSPKEVIEWHNNTLLANPVKKPFYRLGFNALVNSNELQNYGTAGSNATLTNYTADQLNPAHADYALTEINNLR